MTLIRLFVLIIVVCVIFMESRLVPRSMEIIPERAEITDINTKYTGDNSTLTVRRASRGGKYVVRFAGFNKHVWANNVSIFIYVYEYLHNEYRRTFVQMSYKFCDFINIDTYGTWLLRGHGVICPLPPRNWDLRNITLAFPNFPYLIPFTKCKAEVVFKRMIPTEELIGRGFLYLRIKQI